VSDDDKKKRSRSKIARAREAGCAGCDFYDTDTSQCRRYAPSPSRRRYQTVKPDFWCGEWAPR